MLQELAKELQSRPKPETAAPSPALQKLREMRKYCNTYNHEYFENRWEKVNQLELEQIAQSIEHTPESKRILLEEMAEIRRIDRLQTLYSAVLREAGRKEHDTKGGGVAFYEMYQSGINAAEQRISRAEEKDKAEAAAICEQIGLDLE